MDKNYISRFNIDINRISTPTDIQNELYDKIYYQLGIEPITAPKDIELFESMDPVFWNGVQIQLEELELRQYMDCHFDQKDLLEKDLNKSIDLIVKILNFIGVNVESAMVA